MLLHVSCHLNVKQFSDSVGVMCALRLTVDYHLGISLLERGIIGLSKTRAQSGWNFNAICSLLPQDAEDLRVFIQSQLPHSDLFECQD